MLNIAQTDILNQLTQSNSVSPYLLASEKLSISFPTLLTLFWDEE